MVEPIMGSTKCALIFAPKTRNKKEPGEPGSPLPLIANTVVNVGKNRAYRGRKQKQNNNYQ
jgi:hypothetical protein